MLAMVVSLSQLPLATTGAADAVTLIESRVEVNRGDPDRLDVGDDIYLRFGQEVSPEPQADDFHLMVLVHSEEHRVDLALIDHRPDGGVLDAVWQVRVSGLPSAPLPFPVTLQSVGGVQGTGGVDLSGDVTLDEVPGSGGPWIPDPPHVEEAAMFVDEDDLGQIDAGDRLGVRFSRRMIQTDDAVLTVDHGGSTYDLSCEVHSCSFDEATYWLTMDVTAGGSQVPLPATLVGVQNAMDGSYLRAVVDEGGPHQITFGQEPFPWLTAPQSVAATSASPGVLDVTWARPDRDGGNPITSYRVDLDRAPFDVGGAGDLAYPGIAPDRRSLTIPGLPEGAEYRVTVTAITGTPGDVPRHRCEGECSSAPVAVEIAVTPPPPPPPPPPPTPPAASSGYWMVGAKGTVYDFGTAEHHGDADVSGDRVAVDIEASPTGDGYWIVDDGGKVFALGDAVYHGDIVSMPPGETVTAISSTSTGDGYWLFTDIGRALAFGDAREHGDMSRAPLNGPVLDSTRTPPGDGYWMVASDGGIFSFGDARFHGSMGGKPLNAPVRSMAGDPDGSGYWLVAGDGGIFSFDAPFRGSMGGKPLNKPIIGMVAYGNGYLMVASDGGIFSFSDKPFHGSLGADPPAVPVVGVTTL